MKLPHRKSRWQRLIKPVTTHVPPVGRSGLAAVGTAVGMTVASAVVSSIRHRKDES